MNNSSITASILAKLADIEQEKDVQIIYAVESGSRAWGFESIDSDYDVRFIYRHKPEWYISVLPKRDVIEYPISDLLDFSGWDIRKALFLLNKSNPVLFEWLNSPIVYSKQEAIFTELKAASDLYFSPKSCIYHYLHMAKGNYREYLQSELVRLKKYLYVLRPLCACMWIEEYNSAPPMKFETLLSDLSFAGDFSEALSGLIEEKKRGIEADRVPIRRVLNDFIEGKIEYFSQKASGFNPAEKPSADELDHLLRSLISEQI